MEVLQSPDSILLDVSPSYIVPRLHVSQACTRCRLLRKRCGGGNPCSRCHKRADVSCCIYEEVSQAQRAQRKRRALLEKLSVTSQADSTSSPSALEPVKKTCAGCGGEYRKATVDGLFFGELSASSCYANDLPNLSQGTADIHESFVGLTNVYEQSQTEVFHWRKWQFWKSSFRNLLDFFYSARNEFMKGRQPFSKSTFNWWLSRSVQYVQGSEFFLSDEVADIETLFAGLSLLPDGHDTLLDSMAVSQSGDELFLSEDELLALMDATSQLFNACDVDRICQERLEAFRLCYETSPIAVFTCRYSPRSADDCYMNQTAVDLMGFDLSGMFSEERALDAVMQLWQPEEWGRIFSMMFHCHVKQLSTFSLRTTINHASGHKLDAVFSMEFLYSPVDNSPLMKVYYVTPIAPESE